MRLTARRRLWIALVLGLLWLVSLGLPAAHLADGDAPVGLAILTIGWVALFGFQPAWLGNLLIWLALPLIATAGEPKFRTLRVTGFVLIFCAGCALFWNDLPDDGGSNRIAAYGAGFYLWMAAVTGTGLAAIVTASTEPFYE